MNLLGFNDYVATDPDLWSLGNTIPRRGQVHGKPVMLRRFYIQSSAGCGTSGIDLSAWPENLTFSKP